MPCSVSITHGFDDMIISESINKYRHTFTYGEFQFLSQGDSARPWASTPVRGVPWVGCGTFWSVLLRLAAGVTCCALRFEHLAPEIFPSQIAPLHLFITTEKQSIGLNNISQLSALSAPTYGFKANCARCSLMGWIGEERGKAQE